MLRRLMTAALWPLKTLQAARWRLTRVEPCYFIRDTLTAQSIVVDCGLGPDADFSQAIIRRYGCICHGFDPTRRHQRSLSAVCDQYPSRFRLYPYAVAGTSGVVTFYENPSQVSGSVCSGHINVRCGAAECYEVRAVTLTGLMDTVGSSVIDLLKLDVEGCEYEVLAGLSPALAARIPQLVVEFHHHCITGVRGSATRQTIGHLADLGYASYTRDGLNYLFFQG